MNINFLKGDGNMCKLANHVQVWIVGVTLTVLLTLSMGAQAAVKIQFDLGNGGSPFTQSVSSPGLSAGAFTAADTTWNGTVSSITSYSNLAYTDGSAANGVVAQYGATGATASPTSTINWNDNTNLGNT